MQADALPAPCDVSGRDPRRDPDYWARPLPSFGAETPRILIVGLAPGMHGANRTGRPFTGDFAGILLYETLFERVLRPPRPRLRRDGLDAQQARIANAVKCVPPQNKPLPEEIRCLQRLPGAGAGRLEKCAWCWRSAALRTTRCCLRMGCRAALFFLRTDASTG